jgi:hypothetical protein
MTNQMTNQRFACSVFFLFALCCVFANLETATSEEKWLQGSEAGRVAFRNIVVTPAK